ncbi:DUF2937 family protein [Paracoccus spongiarum]|uniref:DUF2937 family protein n=1 Tax=Paracoccus spongiarum TaxID=3064387 RepID=A0ABT9JGS5_9RHOB|nr:DUF2937 family protein [Paracoccus sp. 2205BS29-5]MDP5308251.1 DUF2937 family protein [Paracoccus sp. 2205BS29-5]
MTGALRLAAAACCAAALSQFPAFSDQYLQRLGGQIDALSAVADRFDASAAAAGMTREAALADLQGSAFRAAHQADMRLAFRRLERLRADHQMLRIATPMERILLPHRLRDPQTLAATWGDFAPALPVSVAGVVAALIGAVAGWLIAGVVLLPFRTRRRDRLGWR